MNKYLKNYYNAVEELTKHFCNKYFKGVYEYDVNDWVGSDIGGIICINDYWFNLNHIVVAFTYKATNRELFGFYEYNLKKHLAKEDCISFENYLKYFRGFSFKEIDKTLKNGKK